MEQIETEAVIDAYRHGLLLIWRLIVGFVKHYLYLLGWMVVFYGILVMWAIVLAPASLLPWQPARTLAVVVLFVAAPLSWGALYRWHLLDREEDPNASETDE